MVHLGGFEISFIYKLYVPVGDCNYEKEEKKKEKEKKEKGEEKKRKGKEARRAAASNRSPLLVVARSLLAVVGLAILPSPPLSPVPFFFLLLSLSNLLSCLSIFIISCSQVFNSHFSEAFQSVTPRLAANTPPPPPSLSISSSLSSSLSLYSRSLDTSAVQHPAQTERTNGFLSLFPRFSGAEENVTDFESRNAVVTRQAR